MAIDKEDHLNRNALRAALGWTYDWREPLIELLRSDHQISSDVRNALADAIEGKGPWGALLTLSGHTKGVANATRSFEVNRRKFAIGRWMQSRIEAEESVSIEAAAFDTVDFWKLGERGEPAAKKARLYYKDVIAWISKVRELGADGGWSDEQLAERYHAFVAMKKTPLTPTGNPI